MKMDELNISDKINQCISRGFKGLHISIFIQNQVLFQIVPSQTLLRFGFTNHFHNSFAAVHFFNKNKTLTFEKLSKFKNTELGQNYFYFEDPKNNFNYAKEVGNNPKIIEQYILDCIKNIYELETLANLTIEYADY